MVNKMAILLLSMSFLNNQHMDAMQEQALAKHKVLTNSEKGFLEACRTKDVDAVGNFIETGLNINKIRDKDGEAALHLAVRNEDAQTIRLLIRNNADINVRDSSWGWTPLHSACSDYNYKIAKLLIDNGADVNAATDGGETALHFAAHNCWSTRLKMIELLVASGAEVNCQDNAGFTPLHNASESHYRYENVKVLLEHGAEISESNLGTCPFRMAIYANNSENLLLLLTHVGPEDLKTISEIYKSVNKINSRKRVEAENLYSLFSIREAWLVKTKQAFFKSGQFYEQSLWDMIQEKKETYVHMLIKGIIFSDKFTDLPQGIQNQVDENIHKLLENHKRTGSLSNNKLKNSAK